MGVEDSIGLPKYALGDWVVAVRGTCVGNPAFDDWYGGEEPYHTIRKGDMGRISAVFPASEIWADRGFGHAYVCDYGPLSGRYLPENLLAPFDGDTIGTIRREREMLDDLIRWAEARRGKK
ncbi:hypothetical protein KY363_04810 [Candidatus Woesearchaeota archaeon]|nr:hypothetical protein [Candidatus Woesearchaeota archaeon]